MTTNAGHGGCWDTAAVDADADFTGVDVVFGYGSLCWKPPCEPEQIVESFPARIDGFSRRFWQRSHDHRGTPESPGLVVTILRDDHPDCAALGEKPHSTFGSAFRIRDIGAILPSLDFREKNGYTRTAVPIRHHQTGASLGRAILYYAEPGNDPTYAGAMTDEVAAAIIGGAEGPSGRNVDYLLRLHEFCETNQVHDEHISNLVRLVREGEGAGQCGQPGAAPSPPAGPPTAPPPADRPPETPCSPEAPSPPPSSSSAPAATAAPPPASTAPPAALPPGTAAAPPAPAAASSGTSAL